MDKKRWKFGIGELMFGVIIILGIISTVSFFAFEEVLGEHQATFMIASSLAFIAFFFILSVYARAKKRSHLRRMNLDRALVNWIEYTGSSGSTRDASKNLRAGTLESIVISVFTKDGFRFSPGGVKRTDGLIRLLNKEGLVVLIQIEQDHQPLGLRDVVSFYEILRTEQAALGEIWALGGFTDEAVKWVNKKPITLVDAQDIHQTVDDLIARKRLTDSSVGE
jgi:hypothetical protein